MKYETVKKALTKIFTMTKKEMKMNDEVETKKKIIDELEDKYWEEKLMVDIEEGEWLVEALEEWLLYLYEDEISKLTLGKRCQYHRRHQYRKTFIFFTFDKSRHNYSLNVVDFHISNIGSVLCIYRCFSRLSKNFSFMIIIFLKLELNYMIFLNFINVRVHLSNWSWSIIL